MEFDSFLIHILKEFIFLNEQSFELPDIHYSKLSNYAFINCYKNHCTKIICLLWRYLNNFDKWKLWSEFKNDRLYFSILKKYTSIIYYITIYNFIWDWYVFINKKNVYIWNSLCIYDWHFFKLNLWKNIFCCFLFFILNFTLLCPLLSWSRITYVLKKKSLMTICFFFAVIMFFLGNNAFCL